MMPRLLRGRMFYLLLALLSTFLYYRISQYPVIDPGVEAVAPVEMPQGVQTYNWWPGAHDAQSLGEYMAREPAFGLFFVTFTFFLLFLGIGGVVFTLWGLWTGQIRRVWEFGAHPPPGWSFGEFTRLLVLAFVLSSLLPFVRLGLLAIWPTLVLDLHLWMTISMLVLDFVAVLAVLVFASGKGGPVRRHFGFTVSKMGEAVTIGFRGYLALFPWLFFLLFLMVELSRTLGMKPPVEPIQQLLFQEERPLVLGLTILLACLLGPVAEEFFFRGVLYAAMRRRLARLPAMLLTGALFSLVHTNVIGFLPVTALGGLLAYLYERTGSLMSPIAVHIVHNTLLMCLSLLFRQLMGA